MTESQNEQIYNLFCIGDKVQIIDLQTEKYNDKQAVIAGPYLLDTKRWPVTLGDDHKDQLAIKTENLKGVITDDVKEENDPTKKEAKEEKKEENHRFPVRVFVRMRPLVGLEIKEKHQSIEYGVKKLKKKKTETLTMKKCAGRNNERDKKYAGFTRIIQPDYDNLKTFDSCIKNTCAPSLFKGENVCVFAYGHTGSGKTHTIFGYKKENVPGMYQLFAGRLLADERVKNAEDVFVEIRFCELYQGKVYDLLSKEKRECFMREGQDGVVQIRADPVKCDDGKVRAYPINNIRLHDEDELLRVIEDGISSRNVGNSTLHDKSSRSHAFLEFELVSTELKEARKKLIDKDADVLLLELLLGSFGQKKIAEKKYAKRGQKVPEVLMKRFEMMEGARNGRKYLEIEEELGAEQKELAKIQETVKKLSNDPKRPYVGKTACFVDLAGNEYGRDVKNNDAQEEAERNEINKSLLSLKECIRGLHNNKTHIGYRSSKLTMYLKKFLSGEGSKAIMIANVGTSKHYTKQTINTLQYSQLVAKA